MLRLVAIFARQGEREAHPVQCVRRANLLLIYCFNRFYDIARENMFLSSVIISLMDLYINILTISLHDSMVKYKV